MDAGSAYLSSSVFFSSDGEFFSSDGEQDRRASQQRPPRELCVRE
jgi:hypothetical protein